MSRHPNSARFHEILAELGALHDRKQADYGRDDDPFPNVRASEEWGVAPWVGAMVRLNDKVKRLQTFAIKGSLANEGVEDSLRDIAVYAVIALVLWEQGAVLTKTGDSSDELDVRTTPAECDVSPPRVETARDIMDRIHAAKGPR